MKRYCVQGCWTVSLQVSQTLEAVILYQGSKTTSAPLRRASTSVALGHCPASGPAVPGSGFSAWWCCVPDRCHRSFQVIGCGEDITASLCQFLLRASVGWQSQQSKRFLASSLTAYSKMVTLSPEMPLYPQNTKLDKTPIL